MSETKADAISFCGRYHKTAKVYSAKVLNGTERIDGKDSYLFEPNL